MPVYPDATPDEIRHFAPEARMRFMLAEDQEQVDKMLDLRERGAAIEHIVYDDPRGLAGYPRCRASCPGTGWSRAAPSGSRASRRCATR